MKGVVVFLRADVYGNELVALGAPNGFTPREEVRAGAADGIFEGVGYEAG